MSNNPVVKSKFVLAVYFTILPIVFGLSSCGGSGQSTARGLPSAASNIYASASPGLIAPGASSVITWTSNSTITCSASPANMIASGASTGTHGSFTTTQLTKSAEFTITCGSDNRRVIVSVLPASFDNGVAAACAAIPEPDPAIGHVYYYCDCGAGADPSCVPGDDTKNTGITKSSPKRTIANAISLYNTLTGNNTIAFCKGGAFDYTAIYWYGLSNSTCTTGTCNDLREYAPTTFTSTAKPIIHNGGGNATLFFVGNHTGGVRILNLSLKGDSGKLGNGNTALFAYTGAHDVTMCNNDMDAFDQAINNAPTTDSKGNPVNTNRIVITGNNFTNSRRFAYFGGGDNAEVSHNIFEGNGSSNTLDHTVYFAALATNLQVIGNYIHGQLGDSCIGASMIAHGAFDGILVKDNIITMDADKVAASCWGIGFNNNTNATHATYYRNAVFSGNKIINTGNLGITVSSCPGCIIENNVITSDYRSGMTGINVPVYAKDQALAGRGDDLNTAGTIRNNTIWFGPNSTGGGTGIKVGVEGTGYIITNNTVTYTATDAGIWGGVNCFDYSLDLASFTYIDNNHCFSNVEFKWEKTHGATLASWKTYVSQSPNFLSFDALSIEGSDPLFTAPGTDFTPRTSPTPSPLIGAGAGASAYRSVTDITGKPRPILPALPAIGAFEP